MMCAEEMRCPFDGLAAEVTSKWGAEVGEGMNATHRAQLRGTRAWGLFGLTSLGDRLRDGDLWAGAVFGGVFGTDTWGAVVNRRHRETFGCCGCTYHKASADPSGMALWHCPERTCHW